MNLKTITFDADSYQLVPKRLSNAMRLVYDAELSIGMNYDAMLREAREQKK